MGHSKKSSKEVNNDWELDAWESLYILKEDEVRHEY
jgi:hypothetical protein